VTVQTIGSAWWRRLVDCYDLRIFRRVTKVSLDGPRYTRDLLPHLAKLTDLRELHLVSTSIAADDLELWKAQHPRVAVVATQPARLPTEAAIWK
jgi:hypothetical protein